MSNKHDRPDRHDDLDAVERLIGDVARTLTASPPRAGLARRVETRIAGKDARRGRRSWARSWVLAPAAAACVLVLAVIVARKGEAPRPGGRVIAVQTAPTLVTPAPAPQDISEAGAPGSDGRAGVARAARRSPSVAAAPVAVPADAAIAPLALSPISAIERIEVQPLARGDRIDITGIAIEPIEIAPMP